MLILIIKVITNVKGYFYVNIIYRLAIKIAQKLVNFIYLINLKTIIIWIPII
jgi:hypothetical protein